MTVAVWPPLVPHSLQGSGAQMKAAPLEGGRGGWADTGHPAILALFPKPGSRFSLKKCCNMRSLSVTSRPEISGRNTPSRAPSPASQGMEDLEQHGPLFCTTRPLRHSSVGTGQEEMLLADNRPSQHMASGHWMSAGQRGECRWWGAGSSPAHRLLAKHSIRNDELLGSQVCLAGRQS